MGYLYLDNNIASPDDIVSDNVSLKGIVASQISECNEIVFTEILFSDMLDELETDEIVGIMALFSNDGKNDSTNNSKNNTFLDEVKLPLRMKNVILHIKDGIRDCLDLQNEYGIELMMDWDISIQMVVPAYMWSQGYSFGEVYQETGLEMFEGNFIRNMVKINNICKDVAKSAEIINNPILCQKMIDIEDKLMRDVVTVESLYLK